MKDGLSNPGAIVIGAGPVGLFAIFALGMARIKTVVVDALDAPGGQCAALYPEKPIYDIPAQPSILALDLIERLLEQAKPFGPEFLMGVTASRLSRDASGQWRLALSDGRELSAPVVVIAAGNGAFGPNRPPLPGIEAYEGQGEGRGVHYYVRRAADFAGKRVVIAGGGDSAVDWAILLAETAKSVQIVHRRDKFRAQPESEARLKALAAEGKIELVTPYQLHGLEGEGRALRAVVVADLDGKTRRLEADALLPFFGLAADLGPIASWGLKVEEGRIRVDPATCMTNLEGVFAIGDVALYQGKLKLIATGFAEAAQAAHAAFSYAHPGQSRHVEHSTSTGVPATPS
jgi:thioredoxin reductase (NADPH)